ncbi:pantothenate synthase [Agyrium rufum]|nr:pantothenate synthase [Agyrium rufum]
MKGLTISHSFEKFEAVSQLRAKRRSLLLQGRTMGLVPTMGALHDGHLSLIRKAAEENDDVWISIYVNPTQFGQNEDLSTYPRPLKDDLQKIENLGHDLRRDGYKGEITGVFLPSTQEIYPSAPPSSAADTAGTFVNVSPLGSILEGASRPVFFRGVATVCMKLFNIFQPENVYFGQKDIQQLMLINRMVHDLHVDTKVNFVPTSREPDGLALSSRNIYLGERRRKVATVLIQALRAAEEAYKEGEDSAQQLLQAGEDIVASIQKQQDALPRSERAVIEVDYLTILDPISLETPKSVGQTINRQHGAILCGAIKMLPLEDPSSEEQLGLGGDKGVVRLIDNLLLEPKAVVLAMRKATE